MKLPNGAGDTCRIESWGKWSALPFCFRQGWLHGAEPAGPIRQVIFASGHPGWWSLAASEAEIILGLS
jgi:hypothetical protein